MPHVVSSVVYSVITINYPKHLSPWLLILKTTEIFRVVRRLETINTNRAAYSIYSHALLTIAVRSFFLPVICVQHTKKHANWRALPGFRPTDAYCTGFHTPLYPSDITRILYQIVCIYTSD